MILVLVPNPSADKVSLVPGFSAGGSYRARQTRWYAGGKGFHFARALHTLGEIPSIVAPLAGSIGELLRQLAGSEGFQCDFHPQAGETRTGLVIVDEQNGRITELYESGPDLSEDGWQGILARAKPQLEGCQVLAVCGSFPPGTPSHALAELVEWSEARGRPALLDTHGAHLREALSAHPSLVKINYGEAGELLGRPIFGAGETLEAATRIQELGAQAVVITLGAQGALGLDIRGQPFAWSAPPVQAVFPPGSGDSFFAGLVHGLLQGQSLSEAARLGVAAGSANAQSLGPGVFAAGQVYELLERVVPLDIN